MSISPDFPRISVIVISFGRDTFYGKALNSIRIQTLPPNDVVLICNFSVNEEEMRRSVDFQLKVIHSDTLFLGPMIRQATKACNGDLICFLEDDDEFAPNKLEWVATEFAKAKELVYLRNNVSFMNEFGEQTTDPTPRHRKYISRKKILSCTHSNLHDFVVFFKADAYFNLSSISVRKELIRNLTKDIDRVWLGLDFYIFYAAFAHGAGAKSSYMKLTKYRIHNTNVSKLSGLNSYKKMSTAFVFAMRLQPTTKRNFIRSHAYLTLQFLKVRLLADIRYRQKKTYFSIAFNIIRRPRDVFVYLMSHPPFSLYNFYILLKRMLI